MRPKSAKDSIGFASTGIPYDGHESQEHVSVALRRLEETRLTQQDRSTFRFSLHTRRQYDAGK